MIVVAGHWEIGYVTPIQEANYWNLVLRDFNVGHWRMTPVSGIRHNEQQRVMLEEFPDYAAMLEAEPQLQRVFVEPRTKKQPDTLWLHEFEHPENCMYVFGSAHFNPTIGHRRQEDQVVSIKTVQDKGALWSNQCLTLVLYDRMQKQWQSQ